MECSNLTLEQTQELIKKVGGVENALGIISGEIRVALEQASFPIWKQIQIGGCNADQLLGLLQQRYSKHVDSINELVLQKPAFTTLAMSKVLNLARRTVLDLGFTEEPTLQQVKERVVALGGVLCPAELGAYLPLNYGNETTDETNFILLDFPPATNTRTQAPMDVVVHVGRKTKDTGFNQRVAENYVFAAYKHQHETVGLGVQVVFVIPNIN